MANKRAVILFRRSPKVESNQYYVDFDRISSRNEQGYRQKDETDSIADSEQTDPSSADCKSPVKLAAANDGKLKTISKRSDFTLKSTKEIAKFIMNSNIHIQYNQERKQRIDFESLHLPKHQKDTHYSQFLMENHSEVSQERMFEVMNDEGSQNPNTQRRYQHASSMPFNDNEHLSWKLNFNRLSMKSIRHS
jgi:hypothetical protein